MKHQPAEPWYADGLAFSCTRCGDCCRGAPGYVWVNATEIAAIARHLQEPLEQVLAVYTRLVGRERSLRERSNGDCIFWDATVGCTIYPVRPRQCRTWPFWHSNVATPQDWERTCRICPGCGKGEVISAEEITRRVRVIHL
jgi:Fe-S-cluster containining protein